MTARLRHRPPSRPSKAVFRAVAFAGLLLAVCTAARAAASDALALDTIDQRAKPCAACHGPEGRSTNDGFYPRIAGKPAEYLYNQLKNFQIRRRHNSVMSYMVERQQDDYLRELAAYFANQDLPYPAPQKLATNPAMLERGRLLAVEGDKTKDLPACQTCHGERLTGAKPTIPGLLGLPYSYVVSQLGAWRQLSRRAAEPDCMAQISDRLGDEDMTAVAAWLASQPVPADSHPDARIREPLPMKCGSVAEAAQ